MFPDASTSAKTILAPRRRNALAVETKVNEGTITSSPGAMSRRRADISSACVAEVTVSAGQPSISRSFSSQRLPNGPPPAVCPCSASAIRSSSLPSRTDLLKGIAASMRARKISFLPGAVNREGHQQGGQSERAPFEDPGKKVAAERVEAHPQVH